MKGRINFYFSMLLVAIMGAGATLLIMHVANANSFSTITQREILQELR